MSQSVKVLVAMLHRGKFLKVGDIVPADRILLELCNPANRYQKRQFCEVVEQESVVEQPEKKSKKKPAETVPVPDNIEEIIQTATEGAF